VPFYLHQPDQVGSSAASGGGAEWAMKDDSLEAWSRMVEV